MESYMIDAVIPAHKKDIDTLDLCIDGIRQNVKDIRRIIVVSKDKLTDNAEFYPESNFSFSPWSCRTLAGSNKSFFPFFISSVSFK